MKYRVNDTVTINNVEWSIAEYRMGRGREYKYTLSHEETDGSYVTMSLNEKAMDGLALTGGMLNNKEKTLASIMGSGEEIDGMYTDDEVREWDAIMRESKELNKKR